MKLNFLPINIAQAEKENNTSFFDEIKHMQRGSFSAMVFLARAGGMSDDLINKKYRELSLDGFIVELTEGLIDGGFLGGVDKQKMKSVLRQTMAEARQEILDHSQSGGKA